MKNIIVVLSGIFISSCMHVGMMGTGSGHHSGATHEMPSESVLEKEVIVGDIKATATFPPLQMDSDVVVSLRLTDARTSQPISGAEVSFHAQYAHTLDPNETHDNSSSRTTGHPESEHDISIELVVKESREAGMYSTFYGSTQPGEHTLMFHIAAIGERRLEPELVVEAKRILPSQSHDHGGGIMSGTNATTYVIIGAAVMGAVMVAMLATRSGMF